MTLEELGLLIVEVKERCKSNTIRLDNIDVAMKENTALVSAIKELAVETKYMREDVNQALQRITQLESNDSGKWDKFKWAVLIAVIAIVVGYLAGQAGLK